MSRRQTATKSRTPRRAQKEQSPANVEARTETRTRKRSWRWSWSVAITVVVLVGAGLWYIAFGLSSSPTTPTKPTTFNGVNPQSTITANPFPSATPTPTRNWHTFQSFQGTDTGNKTQKTQTFSVPNTWQLKWDCQGKNGVDDWLYVAIYHADGTLYSGAAEVTCLAANKVIGSEVEQASGSVYLTIDANTDWTLDLQSP